MVREPGYTSIRISKKNYDILKNKGNVTECFDDVISKLLKEENKVRD
jgi:hypothetical protein